MQSNMARTSVQQRRIVDAMTRVLHALMALSFGLAYITAETEGLRWVHVTMGYTLGAAFLIRVVWGVLGPRRVNLWALGERLSGIRQLPELIQRYDWQALLKWVLALSMVVLLVCVLPLVSSGYVTYFDMLGEWTEDIHESIANIMVLAVSGHVGAVALLSRTKSGMPLRPMFTGRVEGKGPDLVKHNLASVAIVLLLLAASFWSWQSYQYMVDPQFMHQPRWLHPEGGYEKDTTQRDHGD